MLWTDADFISDTDLASIDPDIEGTALADILTLSGNNSIIRRGLEEAGRFLETALLSHATYISSNDISANHMAAVFFTGSQPTQRRRVTLDQIVVSGRNDNYWSDVKQWAVNRVLITLYRAASNKSESDRYTNKFESYQCRDRDDTWPTLKKSGIPIVYRPMPCPAALQARDSGTWTASHPSATGTVSGDYDVSITFVDQTKYIDPTRPFNAESGGAARKTVTLATGDVVAIDISNLHPPAGSVEPDRLATGFTVPGRATGWNAYVGHSGGPLFLQNASPIPITLTGPSGAIPTLGGTLTLTLPGDPLLSGYKLNSGQYPETLLTVANMVQRG